MDYWLEMRPGTNERPFLSIRYKKMSIYWHISNITTVPIVLKVGMFILTSA